MTKQYILQTIIIVLLVVAIGIESKTQASLLSVSSVVAPKALPAPTTTQIGSSVPLGGKTVPDAYFEALDDCRDKSRDFFKTKHVSFFVESLNEDYQPPYSCYATKYTKIP